jgi:hypothetical protein
VTVVTLKAYTPSERFDGVPWTRALVHEGPKAAGPWVLIDTIIFPDPDVDPTNPKPRNITTDNAVLTYGWYTVTFVDASGATQQPTAPVYNGAKLEYEPTVDQVARKILSRTRDKYGRMIGTFTNDTAPTDDQVQEIVSDVVTEIADVVGDDIPDALIDDAANVVSLRAAMQIELDYYADQVNTDRSPYNQLKELYDEALAKLSSAVTGATDTDVTGGNPATRPSFGFPDPYFTLDRVW